MTTETLKFNDGTPDIEVEVLVKAESIYMCRDKEDHYLLINRSRLKEFSDDNQDMQEQVEFVEDTEFDNSEPIDDESTFNLIEREQHDLI